MEAPKCRVCGHNHWNTEPHVMGEAQAQPKVSARTPKDKLPVAKFDRTAYQREYMRKWRKNRAAKSNGRRETRHDQSHESSL